MPLARKLNENLDEIKQRLGVGVTFDVLVRELSVGGRDAALIFIDGFIKDTATVHVLKFLMRLRREDLAPQPIEQLLRSGLPYFEVETVSTIDEVVDQVVAGPAALLLDGQTEAIILDLREYPVRSIEEPDLERVTRGSREGLVETIVFNTALIRRRLRDPNLRFEMRSVGKWSRTDVALGYIEGVANPDTVNDIRRRLEEVDVGALTMGSQSLIELLTGQRLNPFPLARLTERPDVTAAHLAEGHVAVITDTSPTALILPANLWHFTQHAEEFFQSPAVGTFMRWARFIAIGLSLVLGPLWLMVATMPSPPDWLAFVGPSESPSVPLWLQFLLLEFGIVLIGQALIHTPSSMSTALGIVGAILLGDLAIQVGFFVPETVLYAAIIALMSFATPSLEFAHALRLFRYLLFILVAIWGGWGFIAGLLVTLLCLGFTNSFGLPYLYPLIPFNGKALVRLLFRFPIPQVGVRSAPKKDRKGAYPES